MFPICPYGIVLKNGQLSLNYAATEYQTMYRHGK